MTLRGFLAVATAAAAFAVSVPDSSACELSHSLKPIDRPNAICFDEVCLDPFYAAFNPDLCSGNPPPCSPCDPAKYPPGTPLPAICDKLSKPGLCWTGEYCDLIEKTSFQGGRWIIKKGRYSGPTTVPTGELVIDRVDILSTNTRTGQKVQMSAKTTADAGNPAGSVCPPAPQLAGSDALTCTVVQFLTKHATKICQDGTTTSCPNNQKKLPIFDDFGDVEKLMRGVSVNIGTAIIEHSKQASPSFYYNICCSGLVGMMGDVIEEEGYFSMRDPADLAGANCQVISLRESGGHTSDTWPDAQDSPVMCQPIP